LFGWTRPNNKNDKLTVLFEKMQVGQKQRILGPIKDYNNKTTENNDQIAGCILGDIS
jgi:hypothetical protein